LAQADSIRAAASREQRQAHQVALAPLADPKAISTAWQLSERLNRDLARLDALRRAMAEARERESEEGRAAR
jgi:hypothetical protein